MCLRTSPMSNSVVGECCLLHGHYACSERPSFCHVAPLNWILYLSSGNKKVLQYSFLKLASRVGGMVVSSRFCMWFGKGFYFNHVKGFHQCCVLHTHCLRGKHREHSLVLTNTHAGRLLPWCFLFTQNSILHFCLSLRHMAHSLNYHAHLWESISPLEDSMCGQFPQPIIHFSKWNWCHYPADCAWTSENISGSKSRFLERCLSHRPHSHREG